MSASRSRENLFLEVWNNTKPQHQQLNDAFFRLTDSDVSENYLSNSMKIIRGLCEKLADTIDPSKPGGPKTPQAAQAIPQSGRDQKLLELWLEHGLITTLLKVADMDIPVAMKTARVDALLAWFALLKYSPVHAPTAGAHKDSQNMRMIKDVAMRMLRFGPPILQVHTTRCIQLWAPGFWSAYTFEEKSEMIFYCLTYAQGNPQPLLDLYWSNKRVQLESLEAELLNSIHPREILVRCWSRSRDSVLFAVAGCLSSEKMFDQRRNCLEIIIARPDIFHQLLSIIDLHTREKSHPDSAGDALACQILVTLLMGPSMWILEYHKSGYFASSVDFPPGRTKKNDEILIEWAAAKSIHAYFIQQQGWKNILLKKWNQLENETYENVLKKVKENSRLFKQGVPESTLVDSVYQWRGTCRCSILRILINLTFCSNLPNNVWFSFLTLAYQASQKVPSEARARKSELHAGIAQLDSLKRRERIVTIERHPTCLSLVVASQYTLGPLLLLRILHCIYKEHGANIVSWTTMPDGTLPHDNLGQVQQIASKEVLGPLMRNIVLNRIPYAKREGTRKFEQKYSANGGRPEAFARSSYMFAAELAMAVMVFERDAGPDKEDWVELVPKAEKELVACLGNISLMSNKLGEFYLSWRYAKLAVRVCTHEIGRSKAGTLEDWDPSAINDKNELRLAHATDELRAVATG